MPLHEQAISILSFRTIGIILVSSDLLSSLVTTQNIFWKFSRIRTKGFAIFRSKTLGSCIDNYHPIHVGGSKSFLSKNTFKKFQNITRFISAGVL